MKVIRFLGLVGALVVAIATPAFAHAELDTKTGEPGANVSLTMHVPVEDDGVTNAKVIIEVPRPFELHSCSATSGWTCVVADEPDSTRTVLTYEPSTPEIPGIEDFTFDVKLPDEDGNYPIEVNQIYSNGTVVQWAGDPDSETPAAVFTVGAGGAVDTDVTVAPDATPTTVGVEAETGRATDAEVAEARDDVADSDDPSETSDKKDTNMAPLYIVIALWLAVVIPVLIAGVKGPEQDEVHTPYHE